MFLQAETSRSRLVRMCETHYKVHGRSHVVSFSDCIRSPYIACMACFCRQRHRGPDWSGCVVWNDCILCHERLAIIDLENGAQPIRNAKNADKAVRFQINLLRWRYYERYCSNTLGAILSLTCVR